jgi:hypothetical protein
MAVSYSLQTSRDFVLKRGQFRRKHTKRSTGFWKHFHCSTLFLVRLLRMSDRVPVRADLTSNHSLGIPLATVRSGAQTPHQWPQGHLVFTGYYFRLVRSWLQESWQIASTCDCASFSLPIQTVGGSIQTIDGCGAETPGQREAHAYATSLSGSTAPDGLHSRTAPIPHAQH